MSEPMDVDEVKAVIRSEFDKILDELATLRARLRREQGAILEVAQYLESTAHGNHAAGIPPSGCTRCKHAASLRAILRGEGTT